MGDFDGKFPPGSATRHGTISGYRLHQTLAQLPCDACYRAKAAYDKRRRAAPERTRRSRLSARAQGRALQRLKKRHLMEYQAYYQEERDRLFAEEQLT